jgi:hypothetical protein
MGLGHLRERLLVMRAAASLSYANVMATVAVFIARGGSSYALVRITSRNVPKDALTGADIRSLTSADVANGRLLAEDFAPGQLPRGEPGPPGSIPGAAAPIDVAANPESASDPCADPSRTLVLCGTASRHWVNGGFGLPGLQVWRDGLGQVHIRGSATIASGS